MTDLSCGMTQHLGSPRAALRCRLAQGCAAGSAFCVLRSASTRLLGPTTCGCATPTGRLVGREVGGEEGSERGVDESLDGVSGLRLPFGNCRLREMSVVFRDKWRAQRQMASAQGRCWEAFCSGAASVLLARSRYAISRWLTYGCAVSCFKSSRAP